MVVIFSYKSEEKKPVSTVCRTHVSSIELEFGFVHIQKGIFTCRAPHATVTELARVQSARMVTIRVAGVKCSI